MKKLKIKLPIFFSEVEIIKGDDISEIEEYISNSENCCIDSSPLRLAATYLLPSGKVVIGIVGNDPYIILHECSHAIFAIKKQIGIADNDEEFFCYSLE